MAKKKFDTNQLDPEFPQKVKETRKFGAAAEIEEAQTRRFDEANFNACQTSFNAAQTAPANYQTAKLNSDVGNASKRIVGKVGLPENILTALPYLPYAGLIAGILELLFVPKSEAKARFHAAQGLAAHIGILLVAMILGGIDGFFPLAATANRIFNIVTTIMLVVFAVKAFRGKPVHIESVDDLTEWLEEKIKPRS